MTREQYLERVDKAKNIVFFGGAGVSTESGIPDFRSVDGLYNQKYKYPPEEILSAPFFYSHTEEFYKFYFEKMICLSAKPNAAHLKLSEWERAGKLKAIVTQNIDGLHQDAGSRNVFELHGSVRRNYCLECGKEFPLDYILRTAPKVPKCNKCGCTVKPDVVLYGEGLPSDTVDGAIEAIASADMLIVGGTSLTVYPAAGLIRYFRGNPDNLILINMTPIPEFNNSLCGKIGELL